MYRFETFHHDIPDTFSSSLAQRLGHVPMGASALDWVALIRSSSPENHEIVIHGIYRGEHFLGIAILSIVYGLEPARYFARPLANLLRLCLRFNIGFLEIPLMNLPGLLTVPGVDPIERGAILHDLRKHLRDTLKLDALSINTDGSILPSREAPCFAGTVPLGFLPNAILPFPYRNREEYWADRPGKKYRKFRADSRALTQQGGRIRVHTEISTIANRVFELYRNTIRAARKKTHHLEMPISINADFFRRAFHFQRLSPRLITVEIDDTIVASALVFKSANTLFLKAIGLDYELSVPSRAYFNLFYALLDHAAQEHCDSINLSITSYRFKQWLGGELHPAAYAGDIHNPLLSLMGRPLAALVARRIGTHGDDNPALAALRAHPGR